MKQEIYNVTKESPSRPSLNVKKQIKLYKMAGGKWIKNPELERVRHLPGVKLKKISEYEI